MEHYAGIDVSLESASVCVVDATERIVREAKVASEPEILIRWFSNVRFAVTRIGLEAGPLSQWLYSGVQPLRQRSGFKPDPRHRNPQTAEPFDQGLWLAGHLGLAHDSPCCVHNA